MSIKPADIEPYVKSTSNVNVETEANRILHVLDHTIARAKFVGLLPFFIENNGSCLKNILDSATLSSVLQACEKYETSFFGRLISSSDESLSKLSRKSDKQVVTSTTSGLSNTLSSGDSGNSEGKQKGRNDNSLSRVIYILEDNPDVEKLAKENEKKLSRQMINFIKSLTQFRNLMEIYLNESAEQYKARESFMRDTYEQNEQAKSEILKLEDELIVTKTGANVCLIGRNILINRHQNKIEKIKRNCMEAIEKRVNESEKAMVNDWKNSMVQQEILKANLEETTARYNAMLEEDLENEKLLRTKRTKVENQILGWIQKFDQDMGDKQLEEEKIQALLDEETKQVNEIQQKLDEQEEDYDELMQEKAEYEEEMLERTLYQFLVNRSVRRIQRSYRMYRARKLAKKFGKKGKKKEKKETKKKEKKK